MANFRTRMNAVNGTAQSLPGVTPSAVAQPLQEMVNAAPAQVVQAPIAPQVVQAPIAPQVVQAPIAPQVVQPSPLGAQPFTVPAPQVVAPAQAAQPNPLAPAQAAPTPGAINGTPMANVALPGQTVVQQAASPFSPRIQGPKGESMSSVIRNNVLAGQDNNTAWQNARAHFGITDPNNKFGYGMANWHRADLRKKGLLAPELDHVTRTRSGGGMRAANKIKAWKNFAEVVRATDAALAAQISNYIAQIEAQIPVEKPTITPVNQPQTLVPSGQ